MKQTVIPKGLALLAAGSDYVPTYVFGTVFSCSPQTARKEHCLNGHCYGIRPIKVGNKLLWPVESIARAIAEASKFSAPANRTATPNLTPQADSNPAASVSMDAINSVSTMSGASA
jgi:hypothetical protein